MQLNYAFSVFGDDEKQSQKGKKRKMNEEITEEDYEMVPRKISNLDTKKKMLLPIKTKHGVVKRSTDAGKYVVKFLQ